MSKESFQKAKNINLGSKDSLAYCPLCSQSTEIISAPSYYICRNVACMNNGKLMMTIREACTIGILKCSCCEGKLAFGLHQQIYCSDPDCDLYDIAVSLSDDEALDYVNLE